MVKYSPSASIFQRGNGVTPQQTKALLSLRSAARKLVVYGDSTIGRMNQSTLNDNNAYRYYNSEQSFIAWFLAISNYAYQVDWAYTGQTNPLGGSDLATGAMQGYGSSRTSHLLANLKSRVLSQQPDEVFLLAGTNDTSAAVDPLSTVANLYSMVQQIIDCGATVRIGTIFPRRGGGWDASAETRRNTINAWIRTLGSQYPAQVKIYDFDNVLADTDGYAKADRFLDGLHTNALGARDAAYYLYGKMMSEEQLPLKLRTLPGQYDATYNLFGNMFVNPGYTGTGGTITSGQGHSGVLPDSTFIGRNVGTAISAACSIVSQQNWNGNAENQIRLNITSSGSGADNNSIGLGFRQSGNANITTGLVKGECYQAEVEVTVRAASGANPLRTVYLEVRDATTGGIYVGTFGPKIPAPQDPDASCFFPVTEEKLILRSPIITAKGTTGLQVRLQLDLDGRVAGSRIVDVGAVFLRRVARPRGELVVPEVLRAERIVGAYDNFVVPAGFRIKGIIVENTHATNAVTGGIKIGTTAGGADIVASFAVPALSYDEIPQASFLKRVFSRTAPTVIYVGAVSSWNSASLNMWVLLEGMPN